MCCPCRLNGGTCIGCGDGILTVVNQIFPFAILDAGAFEDLCGLQTLMEDQVEKCDYGFVCLLCTKAIKNYRHIRDAFDV